MNGIGSIPINRIWIFSLSKAQSYLCTGLNLVMLLRLIYYWLVYVLKWDMLISIGSLLILAIVWLDFREESSTIQSPGNNYGTSHTQLNDVSYCTHDYKSYPNRLRDLNEFSLIRWIEASSVVEKIPTVRVSYGYQEGTKYHIRFVHLFKNWVPSRRKSRGISAISLIWSDMLCWVASGRDRNKAER